MSSGKAMFPYQNRHLTAKERTCDLLKRMTPDEKIDQLVKIRGFDRYQSDGKKIRVAEELCRAVKQRPFGTVYGIFRADWWTKRDAANGIPPAAGKEAVRLFQTLFCRENHLGIPALLVEEAPHGLMALGATVFPVGIAMGATFDAELVFRIGQVIGREAHGAGIGSVYSPILDLAWDPRWSRVEECFSENVFLVTLLGEAMTRGMLTEKLNPTLKHFVGGGRSEGGHNAMSVHLGLQELRNQDLRPFRACIRAGAKFLMPTYHDVDGEPCVGGPVLQKILREELHFDGFATADAGAVEGLKHHRLAQSFAEAAALALKNGCDGESGHQTLEDGGAYLREAFQTGLIGEADLDAAAGRLLKLKFELGLFDHPEAPGEPEKIFGCAAHRAIALEAAEKSLVLLKNNGVLPFRKDIRSIAVVGPNADHAMNMLGDYTAPQKPEDVSTILSGLRAEAENRGIKIFYARGCSIRKNDESEFTAALELAKQCDLTVFVPGTCSTRYGTVETDPVTGAALTPEILDGSDSEKDGGEGTDRATLHFSGVQMKLFQKLVKVSRNVVTVPVLGRPLLLEEILRSSDAVLCAWFPGMCGGEAVARVLFGRVSPSGRLPVSLPRSEGQLPVHALVRDRRPRYCDAESEPLLPFGYGLSYTTFEYSNLTVRGRTVSIDVGNVGNVESDEVVQFYLQMQYFPFQRPLKELFAVKRIHLRPGEKRTVTAELTREALGAFDREGNFVEVNSPVKLFAGHDFNDLQETETNTGEIF